ncbi:hypothetical protein BTA51_13120 [Hahella sp. CCB-MM4]|nr:hypothetical protein BTA51_13120 [Hahella sp. CCB-MM4]
MEKRGTPSETQANITQKIVTIRRESIRDIRNQQIVDIKFQLSWNTPEPQTKRVFLKHSAWKKCVNHQTNNPGKHLNLEHMSSGPSRKNGEKNNNTFLCASKHLGQYSKAVWFL